MNLNDEPLLHQAVLTNDLKLLQKLAEDQDQILLKNSLGFTAIEIARYLNKKACLNILQPSPPRKIQVLRRGTTQIKEMNETDFENFFFIKYLENLQFSRYEQFKKVLSSCPWILNKSILGKENREMALIFQNEISQSFVADTTIKWINDDLGYGLFANNDFPGETFIGEFTGSIKILNRKHASPNAYCFHYPTRFWSWDYTLIDAQKGGNETRFINHSDRPNLKPLCLCEKNLLHIVFISNTNIQKGDQLTYNYGQDFWRLRRKVEI